jgi:ubiquitin carboxyl-terminal hydrolase 25/28
MEEVIDNDLTLRPPGTDPATSQGRQNRAKLLRAWVEVSAWMVDFQRVYGKFTLSMVMRHCAIRVNYSWPV